MTTKVESTSVLSTVELSDAAVPTKGRPQRQEWVSTPDEAILKNDADRARVLAMYATGTPAIVIFALLFFPADPVAILVHQIGLSLCLLGAGWVLARLWKDSSRYSSRDTLVLAIACTIGVASGFYFWGPFSGVIIVIPIGAMLLGQSGQLGRAVFIAVLFLASHAFITLGIVFDVLADRGVNPVGDRPLFAQFIRVLTTQAIMIGTFVVARRIRQSSQETLLELEAASRALSQRDALLAEAARERQEVLRINMPGRYTGQAMGEYKLGIVIGRGAIGVVYAAENKRTGNKAAVKLLQPHLLADPEQFRRFANEVKLASEIDSPYVVKVMEAPIHESFPYIAMELLDGKNLRDHLVESPVLPKEEVLELVVQIGTALRAAHDVGIVHRDLKPRNTFRLDTPQGEVRWKLLDFGTCKKMDDGGSLTEFGKVIGTPAYMAPEQARGAKIDYRADYYSLAVIAYRALTGRPPYVQTNIPSLLHDILYVMPPAPSRVTDGIHPDVDCVFAIALAKQPYDRFATGAEFTRALALALDGKLDNPTRVRGRRLIAENPWGLLDTSVAA